jgi:hypothetical protein
MFRFSGFLSLLCRPYLPAAFPGLRPSRFSFDPPPPYYILTDCFALVVFYIFVYNIFILLYRQTFERGVHFGVHITVSWLYSSMSLATCLHPGNGYSFHPTQKMPRLLLTCPLPTSQVSFVILKIHKMTSSERPLLCLASFAQRTDFKTHPRPTSCSSPSQRLYCVHTTVASLFS